jgi:hypothetical protein
MIRLLLSLLRIAASHSANSAGSAARPGATADEFSGDNPGLFPDHAPQAAPREFDWSL